MTTTMHPPATAGRGKYVRTAPKSTHPLAEAYPSKHPTRRCAEPRCGRPCHGWGTFCSLHSIRQYRFGHASLRAGIRETELKPFAQWVRPMLMKYRTTRGTQNVLALIDDHILNYNAGGSIVRAERDLTSMMMELRSHEVSPSDVLARVCIFQAYCGANVGRFKGSLRAENIALGQITRRLLPMSRTGKRFPMKAVELFGEELRRLVVPYADKLLQLVKDESAKQHDAVLSSLDLTTPADVPVDPPRAGRARRG
jgi:hypothetical protein